MKRLILAIPLILHAETFTGVITDTMCGADHAMMKTTPDSKCVTECMRSPSVKYALLDGKRVYKLSDQASPAPYAGKKVRITGALYPKTGVLQVDKIEAAR
jgi:hypothetical protein